MGVLVESNGMNTLKNNKNDSKFTFIEKIIHSSMIKNKSLEALFI